MENNEEKTPEQASNLFHNIMKASVTQSIGGGKHRQEHKASNGEQFAILVQKNTDHQYNVKAIPYLIDGEPNSNSLPLLHYPTITTDVEKIFSDAKQHIEEELKKSK